MKDQLAPGTAGRRAAAYWFIDGLPEIVAGLGFVALAAAAVWFGHFRPRTWSARTAFGAIEIAALMVVYVWDRSINLLLKSRLTFPRTGYVRPPGNWDEVSQKETVLSLGLTAKSRPPDQNVTHFRSSTIFVLICGNLLAGLIAVPVGLPIAMSVVAILLYALHRGSERPYHWVSVLPLPVAGLGAMQLHMSQDDNAWIALLLGGAWLAAQGVFRLLGYVRRHPKCEPAESVRP
ncbi:MAG: hypothetical protein P4L56_22590 [Candidatus Sulfopaludibacter sp.]|nr:hypothetical protein [Candidatus Sulfopaludibacter sp.]